MWMGRLGTKNAYRILVGQKSTWKTNEYISGNTFGKCIVKMGTGWNWLRIMSSGDLVLKVLSLGVVSWLVSQLFP
jgi:hypothetical protein